MDMLRGVFPKQGEHGGRILDVVEDKGRQTVPGLLLPGMSQFLGHAHGQQGRSRLTAKNGEQIKIIIAVLSAGKLRPETNQAGKLIANRDGSKQYQIQGGQEGLFGFRYILPCRVRFFLSNVKMGMGLDKSHQRIIGNNGIFITPGVGIFRERNQPVPLSRIPKPDKNLSSIETLSQHLAQGLNHSSLSQCPLELLRKGQPLIPVFIFVDVEVSADKKVDPAAYFSGKAKESDSNKPQSEKQPLQHKGHLQPECAHDHGDHPET